MYHVSVDWLNYHHLLYFWVVAREGSVTRAARVLHVSQPAISEQIRNLERFAGCPLFVKSGRGLVLSDTGQAVYRYASDIFALGEELVAMLRGGHIGSSFRLRVGVVDVLPKLIAHKLIEPALRLAERPRISCHEGPLDRLLGDLAIHQLDVVLSEAPMPATLCFRAYSHPLGECGVSVMGVGELAKKYRNRFPSGLNGAPFLLPPTQTLIRRSLDQWFEDQQLRIDIRGEFDDSSLLKTFGQVGEGVFVIPTAIEREVCQQYSVQCVGRIPQIRLRFYAISAERKLKHPAVVAISAAAADRIRD
jgi:LysR family transcriptional regulator, transcriptional activator of nhaA